MELDGSYLTDDPSPYLEEEPFPSSLVLLPNQSLIEDTLFEDEFERFDHLDQSTNYFFEPGLPRLKSVSSEGMGFNTDYSLDQLLNNSTLPAFSCEAAEQSLAVPVIQQPSAPPAFHQASANHRVKALPQPQPQQDSLADKLIRLKALLKANYQSFTSKYFNLVTPIDATPKKTIGLFYSLVFADRKDYLYKKVFRDFRRLVKLVKLNVLDKKLNEKPKLCFFQKTCTEKMRIFNEVRNEVLSTSEIFDQILAFKGKFTVKVMKEFFAHEVVINVFKMFIRLVFTFANHEDYAVVCQLIKANACFVENDEMRRVAQDYLEGLLFLM